MRTVLNARLRHDLFSQPKPWAKYKQRALSCFVLLCTLSNVENSAFAQTAFSAPQKISVSSTAQDGNAESTHCDMGQSGQLIAFDSLATNLLSTATTAGIRQVYLRNNTTQATELISAIPNSSTSAGNGHSEYPRLSADGSVVVFHSKATNLVTGDTNGRSDVFLRIRGASPSTTRISIGNLDTGSAQGNGDSYYPDISSDGRYTIFLSAASNLITTDNDVQSDIFLFDKNGGQLSRVSIGLGDTSPNGSSNAGSPAISGNGRFVVFGSFASNLVASDANNSSDVFVRNLDTATTELVSIAPAGQPWGAGDAIMAMGPGSISSDGRYVTFGVDSDGDAFPDKLYLHDRTTHLTTLLSVNAQGQAANGYGDMIRMDSNANGFVFYSIASNLLASAPTGGMFYLNRTTNQLSLLTAAVSSEPCISRDGSSVGYSEMSTSSFTMQIWKRNKSGATLPPPPGNFKVLP